MGPFFMGGEKMLRSSELELAHSFWAAVEETN